jgi:hypothetical protein
MRRTGFGVDHLKSGHPHRNKRLGRGSNAYFPGLSCKGPWRYVWVGEYTLGPEECNPDDTLSSL